MANTIFGNDTLKSRQIATGASSGEYGRPGIMPVPSDLLPPDRLLSEWEKDTGGEKNAGVGLAVMTESQYIGGVQLGSSSAAKSFDEWYGQKYLSLPQTPASSITPPSTGRPSGYYANPSTGRYEPITRMPITLPTINQPTTNLPYQNTLPNDALREKQLRFGMAGATEQETLAAELAARRERMRIANDLAAQRDFEQRTAIPEVAQLSGVKYENEIDAFDALSSFSETTHADAKYVQDLTNLVASYTEGDMSTVSNKDEYFQQNKSRLQKQAVDRSLRARATEYFSSQNRDIGDFVPESVYKNEMSEKKNETNKLATQKLDAEAKKTAEGKASFLNSISQGVLQPKEEDLKTVAQRYGMSVEDIVSGKPIMFNGQKIGDAKAIIATEFWKRKRTNQRKALRLSNTGSNVRTF